MSAAEDSPTLRSMSIHAFIGHLEETNRTSVSIAKKPVSRLIVDAEDSGSEAAVPLITDIKPRELSSFTILSRSTLTCELHHREVLERTQNLIRAKSLQYTVDLETASVECQTPCDLSFALYFWLNEEGKVLVEIQRRNGCAILMHRVRKALFRALLPQNDSEPEHSTTREEPWLKRCPLHMTVSPRVREMMNRDKEEDKESLILQESLEICEEHLSSERRDLHELAMQSLVHMTDPEDCSSLTANYVSHTLLSETSHDSHLHDEFVHTLRASTRHRLRESFKYEYSGEAPVQEGQHDKTMAILSLTALCNAFKVVRSCDCCSIDGQSHSWRRIAASLKECLHDPARHPQEAAMAARCIRLMEDLDNETAALFSEDEELVAYLTGETTRHNSLAHELSSSAIFG